VERGRDASDATLAVLEHQLQDDEPLAAGEREIAVTVDTETDLLSDIVARVRSRLDQTQAS
jgi:predicted kinase